MQVSQQSPKSGIQTKLESWVPASPQMDTLISRLAEAAERREIELNKVVTRNSVHLSGVKKAQNKVNDRHHDRSTAIREKQSIKVERALESIENQQLRCAQNMERKMEKIIQAKEKANKPLMDQNSFQKKLLEASERKRATLGEVVLNVTQINKAKQEKANLFLQEKEAKVALAQERLNEKMTTASKRKEDNLKAKISKAVEENSVVAERIEEVRKRRDAHVLEIQTKYESKLESATKRKELSEVVLNVSQINKAKQEKANLFLQEKEAKVALAQERLSEKMTTASKRKEDNLKAKISKAVEENSVVAERTEEVRKRRDAHVLEIQTKYESKLESATKRKELSEAIRSPKRRTMHVSVESPNSEIQTKLESWVPPSPQMETLNSRLAEAAERREVELNKVVSNVAQINKAKQEKANLFLQEKEAKVALAQERLSEKMTTASKRKEDNLKAKISKAVEENSVVAERVEEVRKRRDAHVLEIQTKHESKLDSAKKSQNFKLEAQSGATEKIERAKQHKISRDADLCSIKQKIEFKMISANQRKEMNLQARVEKVAEENRVVSEKVQQLQEKHASLVNEIQSKHENKLEAAVKRKEQVQKEVHIGKNEVSSVRREKVLQLGDKQNEEVQKHKENLSLRLTEAAARREELLNKKIDQAGQSSKKSKAKSRSALVLGVTDTSVPPISPVTLEQRLVEETKGVTEHEAEEYEGILHIFQQLPGLILTFTVAAFMNAVSFFKR